MKTKTLIELITLSSSLYVLARDTHLLDKMSDWSEDTIKDVNNMASKAIVDANGNELELIDKLKLKAEEVKEELEIKIEAIVAKLYKKVNIAHLDDVQALKLKLETADNRIALLEARMNKLELKS